MTQHGWQVQYLDYAQFGPYELPSRLFLKRRLGRTETPTAGDEPATLEVRLVVERWTLKQP
jgi:outer membrane biogenesis lipoprotein LolB